MRFKKAYLIESVILLGLILAYLSADFKMWEYDASVYSVADSWLTMMQPMEYTILLLPVLMIGTACDIKYDFLSWRILRYESKQEIFVEQCKRAALRSAWFSALYLTVILMFGRAKGLELCTWNQTSSYFFRSNRCTYEGSLFEVILVLFLLCAIRNMFLSMMIVLSKWYLKNVMAGFLFPMGICIFEMCQSALNGTEHLRIFLRRFMAEYSFWISRKMRGEMVLVLMLYGVLLFFMAVNILKKKEFLDGKKS